MIRFFKEKMKKGTKRKILFISLGIILLLGITAFILAKTGVFVKQFKNIIELELTKALNREVTIEKIEGGIFDSIDLVNVRIASKKDEQGSWNIIDFINSLPVAENSVFPEKLPITVSKGLIGIKDSKKKFNSYFRDIYGNLEFVGQGKLSVKAGSKSFSSKKTNLYVDGLVDLKNKISALIVTGKDLELSHYAGYALTYLPADKTGKLFIEAGKFDLTVKISDDISSGVSAEFLIKNGEARFADFKAVLSGIVSEISLTKESIKIKNFASVLKNSSITARGEIKNAFEGKPEGKVSVYLNRADLADFNEEEIFKGLNPAGICNAGITIEGVFASPAINVFANVRDLRISGVKTENNELVLRYKDKKAVIESLKIYAFDGMAGLSGNYDVIKNYLSLNGAASDMQFGEICNMVGIPGAAGKAAFSIEAKGLLNNITIASKVSVKKAAYVSGSLGDITGDLLFHKNNKLKVSAVSTEKLGIQTVFTFEKNKAFRDEF